ncbi:hypothetical protein [Microscilla marina]|uniref:Lipoprotein, putative n=1 Tax=Microscilla marina ATCC 23134 TaxID=313606 RepID=A1ZRC9_MICM2|nr:hypothetical protein [Microscilla marina]EAY27019.1 lipoprotein, putative [Microscilla marina ATCC 23134]
MKVMKRVYFIIVTMLAMSACGNSGEIKSEKVSIEGNKKKMEALAKEFPAFKNILMLELKKAQQKINQANEMSNGKEKASLLAEANTILEAPFIEKLSSIKKELAAVKEKQKKVQAMRFSGKQKEMAAKVMEDANNIVVEVNGIMNKGVAGVNEANDILSEKSGSLRSISAALSRLIDKK